jgi:hypothetical protein
LFRRKSIRSYIGAKIGVSAPAGHLFAAGFAPSRLGCPRLSGQINFLSLRGSLKAFGLKKPLMIILQLSGQPNRTFLSNVLRSRNTTAFRLAL